MKRRTLDIIFAGGGVVLAALLLVLGFVLADQQSFAKDYVKSELGAQKITFATADKLTDPEKTWKPGSLKPWKYAKVCVTPTSARRASWCKRTPT